jgi:hypothetical protein
LRPSLSVGSAPATKFVATQTRLAPPTSLKAISTESPLVSPPIS